MVRKFLMFGGVFAVVLVGLVAYLYLRPTLPASQQLQSIPITGSTVTPATGAAGTAAAGAPAGTAGPSPAQNQATLDPTANSRQLFEIDASRSEARFLIDEVLEGSPNTVVGATDQIAGQIEVNVASPQDSQVGVIQINARTLTTDNEMRNRAIKNRILYTDRYEFITFTPIGITGLPDVIRIGEPFAFQISGDLMIGAQTHPATFDVEVTPLSETELQGSATATLQYADYGVSIPQVPVVTSVEDTVRLEFDFVAQALGG